MTPLLGWLLYCGAWAAAAVVYAALLVAQGHTTVLEGIASGIVLMSAAGLAGAGVWWLSGRYRLGTRPRVRFFATHLALGLAYAAFCVGVQYAWLRLSAGAAITTAVFEQAGVWMVVEMTLLYGVVAGLSYLFRLQQRLRTQQLAAVRAEAAAARAQVQALRSQLNPHFLFNSLHSLGTLVRHAPDAAELAIEELGALLRYALDQGEQELVQLADEWRFTETYISLERHRLGDRLRVDAALDRDALLCAVPPFLLQPLVENAVRHGIAGRPDGGTISVHARVDGQTLRLVVGDDGEGASPLSVESARGVGLRVLREQLRARYDGRSAVGIRTRPGEGFTVTIELPAERDELS